MRPTPVVVLSGLILTVGIATLLWAPGDGSADAQATAADAAGMTSVRPAASSMPIPPAGLEARAPVATAANLTTTAAPQNDDPLQGLTADERDALTAALAQHPQRDAEMRRVAGFLRLQRQVETWAAAEREPALRRDLAARIEAALPTALATRSVTAGEALQLQSRLIADREPDTARADAELAAWRTRHVPPAAGPDTQERAFLAQQQALASAGSLKPDQLAPALEALRQQHFAATPH